MFKALAALRENPPDVTFDTQEENEEILLLIRRHWVTQVPRILLIIFLVLFPSLVVRYISFDWLFLSPAYLALLVLIWYLLLIAFALESFLNWYFNVFIVTPHRILDIDFWALLYKNVSETGVGHIEDVTYKMGGVIQSLFNYGDVSIQTAAEQREFEFTSAPDPARIHDIVTDLMHQPRKESHHAAP